MASLQSWRAALEQVRRTPLSRDTPGQRRLRDAWVDEVERILKQGARYEAQGIEVEAPKVSAPKVFTMRQVRSLAETRYVKQSFVTGPQGRYKYRAMKKAQRAAAKPWNAQRRRIMRQIARLEERGFTVDVASLNLDPPAFYTASAVERLKRIKAETLYLFSTYRDPETGEVMSGVEGRKLERSRAAKKAYATRKRREENGEYEPRERDEDETQRERNRRREREREDEEEDIPDEHPPGWPDVVLDTLRGQLSDPMLANVADSWNEWLDRLVESSGKEGAAEIVSELAQDGLLDFDHLYDGPAVSGIGPRAATLMRSRGYIEQDEYEDLMSQYAEEIYTAQFDIEDALYQEMMQGGE